MNRLLTPSDRWRLTLLGGCLALLLVFQPLTSITIAPATFVLPILLIAFVGALGLIYRVLGRDEGIAATCFASVATAAVFELRGPAELSWACAAPSAERHAPGPGRPRARTGLVGLCGLAKVQSVCRPGHHPGL